MQPAPIPENEQERLVSLHNLGLLDTTPEERFDVITRLATRIFHVPISTLTLVDAKREWFKSCQGLPKQEGDRAISFCGHALVSPDVLIVPDTLKDDRFTDNPMVTGQPHLRFYAGVPIQSADGARVGVFCIKDTKPREFSKDEQDVLKGLASWAEMEINSRNLSLALEAERKMQEEFNKIQEASKKALLNVMEDLEMTRAQTETEKAKDDAMLASIGDGLIAVDTNGRVTLINKAAENILGWTAKDLIGKELTNLPLEDKQGHLLPLEKRPTTIALATGKITKVVYFFVRKDKTKFPIAITVTPIKLKGETIGLVEIIRDVTREQEIDQAKSEFVSLASHQLRTPLGIVKWYLEALQNESYLIKAPKTVQEYFAEIVKSNERVISLVEDLLSVSRIDAGTVKNAPKPVNIVAAVTDIIKEVQAVAKKKAVKVRLDVKKPNLPSIYIDPLRLHEALENLILNAVQYTPAGGKVVVSVDKNDGFLLLSVKDTGIGISAKDQEKLFTKFFQSERTTAENPGGSGLGLYVVKSYVEGWGGKITVESAEGKGSTFEVSLPIRGHGPERSRGGERR